MKTSNPLLTSIFGGLTNCRDCQEPVSYRAAVCPKCGAPKPGKRWWVSAFWLFVITMLAGMYILIIQWKDEISSFIAFLKSS